MKQKGRKMREGFKRGGRIPGPVSLLPSGPSVSAVVSPTTRAGETEADRGQTVAERVTLGALR